MSSYFCHDCAVANGFLRPPPKGDSLTDNVYKLDKYIKHTIPLSSSSYKTIVTGIASESYQNLVLTTVASGHVQVDGHNRVNIVWIGSGEYRDRASRGKICRRCWCFQSRVPF
jgi:hypothetical protein